MNLNELPAATTEAEAHERRLTLADALRSGTYQQDIRYLHTPKGYCCQGVACELLGGPEVWGELSKRGMNQEAYVVSSFTQRCVSQWPDTVRRYYGYGWRDSDQLMIDNDARVPFPEIADKLLTMGYALA